MRRRWWMWMFSGVMAFILGGCLRNVAAIFGQTFF